MCHRLAVSVREMATETVGSGFALDRPPLAQPPPGGFALETPYQNGVTGQERKPVDPSGNQPTSLRPQLPSHREPHKVCPPFHCAPGVARYGISLGQFAWNGYQAGAPPVAPLTGESPVANRAADVWLSGKSSAGFCANGGCRTGVPFALKPRQRVRLLKPKRPR